MQKSHLYCKYFKNHQFIIEPTVKNYETNLFRFKSVVTTTIYELSIWVQKDNAIKITYLCKVRFLPYFNLMSFKRPGLTALKSVTEKKILMLTKYVLIPMQTILRKIFKKKLNPFQYFSTILHENSHFLLNM